MNDTTKSQWITNGLLAVILVLLTSNYLNSHSKLANAADEGGGWGTNGIMVGAINNPSERVVLVDTKKQNIMIYRSQAGGKFGLSGARSYKYDVELIDTEGKKLGANGWTYLDALREFYAPTK
ncbi:MAG: hypothetical protein WCT04_16170 [Planctomycetota bacterium]